EELADRTETAAGRYAAAGLAPGDRVLVSAQPSVDLVVAYVAALRYGLTVVPVNTAYTETEIGRLVTEAVPGLAVLDDPARVAGAIREHAATLFFGVPTMYHRLAASPHLADLRALRLAVSGSAPLPADLHDAVARGGGQRVLERYGMTETVMLVSNPYEGE